MSSKKTLKGLRELIDYSDENIIRIISCRIKLPFYKATSSDKLPETIIKSYDETIIALIGETSKGVYSAEAKELEDKFFNVIYSRFQVTTYGIAKLKIDELMNSKDFSLNNIDKNTFYRKERHNQIIANVSNLADKFNLRKEPLLNFYKVILDESLKFQVWYAQNQLITSMNFK